MRSDARKRPSERPCRRAGQHDRRNQRSGFASSLDNRGFGFGAELAAEAPAFAAGTAIAIAAKPRILEPLQAYPHRTTLTVAQRPEIADHLGAIGDRAGRAPFTHRP
jgi:hypothetical protein